VDTCPEIDAAGTPIHFKTGGRRDPPLQAWLEPRRIQVMNREENENDGERQERSRASKQP
jgi:hypothetical protein